MATAAMPRYITGPAWAAALGGIAVLFGTLMTAAQGNELMAQLVIAPGPAAARKLTVVMREDEGGEENV